MAKHKHTAAFCTSEKPRRIKKRIGIKQTQLTPRGESYLLSLATWCWTLRPALLQLFPNGFVVSRSLHPSVAWFSTQPKSWSTSPTPLTLWTAYEPYQGTEMNEHQGRASPHPNHMLISSLNSAEHPHPEARQALFLTNLCPWISSVSAPLRDPRTAVQAHVTSVKTICPKGWCNFTGRLHKHHT